MLKSIETDSAPLVREVNKLLETVDSSKGKMYQLKSILTEKQNYFERLDQLNNDELMNIAIKRAELSDLHSGTDILDKQNTTFRNRAKKAYDDGQNCYQYINNLESDFLECEDKLKEIGNKPNNDINQYEKQIDDLTRLLDQLTEKRSKKLALLETQEKRFLEEKTELEQDSFDYEGLMESLTSDDTDTEDEVLENELKDLERKLSILDVDYGKLNNKEKNCENAKDETSEKYPELDELEKRFTQVNNEVTQASKNFKEQEYTKLELEKSTQKLEEYEAKLNEEMQETSKFWNDLNLGPYEGFSKIEQEISQIKADFIERKEKYEVKISESRCTEEIYKKNDEIVATSSNVEQQSSELKELENVPNNLETPMYFSEQYDMMTKETEELRKENEKLNNNFSAIKENEIEKMETLLKENMGKDDLKLIAFENNNLMKVREFETEVALMDGAIANLQHNSQLAENKVKELKKQKNKYYEMQLLSSKRNKAIEVACEEREASMNLTREKLLKLKAKLGTATVPPPIYVKKNDQNFARPKTNDFSGKKISHMKSVAAPKRNWDSDSSMEAEVLRMKDNMKNKYRKRLDAENKKKLPNEL